MITKPVEAKNRTNGKPLEVVQPGSISVTIYRHTNIIPQRDQQGKIIYGPPDASGKPKALVKYQSDIYPLAYDEGSKQVRLKFSKLETARNEANLAAVKIANGDTEALKLKTGHDLADYIRARQKFRDWKPDADLNHLRCDNFVKPRVATQIPYDFAAETLPF